MKHKDEFYYMKENEMSHIYYVNKILELAMSMFEWSNLPPSVDERYLEMQLVLNGKVLFFKDDAMSDVEGEKYLVMKFANAGKLNIYEIPTVRRAFANNGYQNTLTEKDSVIIYNNMIHTNIYSVIENYAKRLSNLDRIIDVNSNAQKTPVLIKTGQKELLSLKNLYKKYDGNAPVIYGDNALDTNNISILNTEAPYICDRIYELKTQLWNECLTMLGISNVSYQKKERLISDEVSRSQGGTIANRYSRLNTRKQACKQINAMFDLNVDCNFRKDVMLNELENDDITEVEASNE